VGLYGHEPRQVPAHHNLNIKSSAATDQHTNPNPRFIDGSWGEQVYRIMVHTKARIRAMPHATVVWRTAPYSLMSTTERTHRVNSIARLAACAARVAIVDWEAVTQDSSVDNHGLLPGDLVHYKTYEKFWSLYEATDMSKAVGQAPCGPVLTSPFDSEKALKEDDMHQIPKEDDTRQPDCLLCFV